MNHNCSVCGNQNISIYRYNDHLGLRIKTLAQFFIMKLITVFAKYISTKIYEKYLFKLIFSPLYKIAKCNDCGYGYYLKDLDNTILEKYYNKLYWQASGLSDPKVFEDAYFLGDERSNAQYNFSNVFINQLNNSKILEIGAGPALISRFIRHHQKGKVEIDVVETGNGWAAYYKTLDINQVANFFPFKTDKQYDYIHTSHWLEHVSDLKDVIKQLKELLVHNGLLFIEVPNCNIYFELDFTDTPHIHFFTLKSLDKILRSAGFEILKSGEYGLTMTETLRLKNHQALEPQILEAAKGSDLKVITREDGANLKILARRIS